MSKKAWGLVLAFVFVGACTSHDGPPDGSVDASPFDTFFSPDSSLAQMCELPGSLKMTSSGPVLIPGGTGPDLGFIKIPVGFCVHYFGNVPVARQIRFAPGGDLFVASPSTPTAGGGTGGLAQVVIAPDDNHDGYEDSPITFMSGLASTQGLLFTSTDFYYQDGTTIQRIPFKAGDRAPSGLPTQFADITYYTSSLHWPKTLDMADDGTIYVGNGGEQSDPCVFPHVFHGGILKIDGVNMGGTQVAQGCRNPIALRCAHGHNQCFAVELALDFSGTGGGREKMFPLHDGDDWGFPCCATKDTPYGGISTDCSGVSAEPVTFKIGETPFGFDFETGKWPAAWAGNAFVAMHGGAGSWTGARILAVAMDPNTGLPISSSDMSGSDTGGMTDFATGWDDGSHNHGRPAAIAFSPDGRLFMANDNNGDIIWFAPFE